MAAAGARAVGSAAWIAAEKENVRALVDQEMEEVEFPVRHEMEWLNEHMGEIFSQNQFNMTEIFKTPGKLRGKTPRTARKRNPDEVRVPLSDIFSSNQPLKSPSKSVVAPENPTTDVFMDKKPVKVQEPTANSKLNSFSTYNTDSGYHGFHDDDEVVLAGTQSEMISHTQPLKEDPMQDKHHVKSPSMDRRTTEGSFHSAQENIRQRGETVEPLELDDDDEAQPDEDTPRPFLKGSQPPREPSASPVQVKDTHDSAPIESPVKEDQDGDTILDNQFDDIGSPSDGSTPDRRPLMRKKSSLSFASLPAREPLMTKKSMGPRVSRTSHVDIVKQNTVGRSSYYNSNQMEGIRTTRAVSVEHEEPTVGEDKLDLNTKPGLLDEDSDVELETTKLHHKSSTQRLHEKINLLGKHQPSRTTKSIAPASHLAAVQGNYPELLSTNADASDGDSRTTSAAEPATAHPEDWIKPLTSQFPANIPKSQTADIMELVAGRETVGNLERGKLERTETFHDLPARRSPLLKSPDFTAFGHKKSTSTSTPPTPQRLEQRLLPASDVVLESTTPPVSPKRFDGTLSVPKSKFQSLMKTAKGLFTSSAGVSAAAKLETLPSPSASRSQLKLPGSPLRNSPSPQRQTARSQSVAEMEKSNQTEVRPKSKLEGLFDRPQEVEKPPIIQGPSNTREKGQPTAAVARDVRETSAAPSANRSSPRKIQRPQTQAIKDTDTHLEAEDKFPLPPSTSHQQPPPVKPNERRPVKPTREVVQKPKPQPVSIRLGSTLTSLTRMPLASASSLSSSIQEPNPPSAPVAAPALKQPTINKKASTSSLQTSASTSSFKSSVSSQTQRKAQQAAAEKKKQEEREAALRKEEQKKRTAQQKQQQEEARRQDRERPVADDPKKASQRQAIDQRRLENARRMERQGSQPPKAATDRGSILQEKANGPQRVDGGPPRPQSRLGSVQAFGRSTNQPPNNAAKPGKRAWEEESQPRPAASTAQSAGQMAESKRRKTEDEHNPPPVRTVTAPPIRVSTATRKESHKPQMFAHGYPQAPPPAAHHQAAASVHRTAGASSHQAQQAPAGPSHRPGHPLDMTNYMNGKIPFAEGPNPAHAAAALKTPRVAVKAAKATKASPQYPNGDNIHLPEINTDSEDDDSDEDMLPKAPWVEADVLRGELRRQENMDIESIFGPIPPFSLEETFKADKKSKRFRDRTSSANWAGPDGLTQDEIRRDIAARRILQMNGEWTFNASH